MADTSTYEEVIMGPCATPVPTAIKLITSGLFEDYLLFERDGTVTLAGGVAGEITADRHRVRLRWGSTIHEAVCDGDVVTAVGRMLRTLPLRDWRCYGWAAFELAYAADGNGDAGNASNGNGNGECGRDRTDEPLLHLILPEVEVVMATEHGRIRALTPAGLAAATRLLADQDDPAGPPADIHPGEVNLLDDGDRYQRAVKAALVDIGEGRLRKVILSRLVDVDFPVDLVATYALGRRHNTPARSFLINIGDVRAAGFSPETVVEVRPDGRVVTQPLAGTRALTNVGAENARLRADLVDNAKEIYEHSISVQLTYDEMRQVCDPHSVVVEEFMQVRERGTVQHLGSVVSGRLAADRDAWDAFRTVFPAVTASGVPKTAAYDCIRRLEPTPRDLYGGAVLSVGSDGSLDAALVLRTVFQRDGRTWLRAGAGIVEQSTPEREFEETCEKLRSIALYLVPDAAPSAPGDGPGHPAGGR